MTLRPARAVALGVRRPLRLGPPAGAAETAGTRRRVIAKEAQKAKRKNAKREKSAQLPKLEAREESLAAQAVAARAKREADRLREAASEAKEARKSGG